MRSDEEALEVVARAYYRNPDPTLATRALRQWLQMLASADEAQLGRLVILMYVLARISQRSAEAQTTFDPILRGYQGPHAALAQRLLDPQLPDVLHAAIERPENLDLLWAEFFVTGEAAPIARIFAVLDAPDFIRARLEAWLSESSLFGKTKRRDAATALCAAGLVVDLERKAIASTGASTADASRSPRAVSRSSSSCHSICHPRSCKCSRPRVQPCGRCGSMPAITSGSRRSWPSKRGVLAAPRAC